MIDNIRIVSHLQHLHLKQELTQKRVWLGVLLGIGLAMLGGNGYLQYANDINHPVQFLETYIVSANSFNKAIFQPLGWFLIISDVPFIQKNDMLVIYRTNKKNWNTMIINYLIIMDIIYQSCIVISMCLISLKQSYTGNIWSIPMQYIVQDQIGQTRYLYDIDFSYQLFIRNNHVYTAFVHTFLCNLLYDLILGMFLYNVSFFMNKKYGIGLTVFLHFIEYELLKEGYGLGVNSSLLGRSIAAFQFDAGNSTQIQNSYVVFMIVIVCLVSCSFKVIKKWI